MPPLPLARQHLCEHRVEVGISGGRAGALAEQLAVPASSLRALPDAVDDAAGAMVEPGANALRAVWAAELQPRDRVLVLGPGTIGLLVAQFARAAGAEVHVDGQARYPVVIRRVAGARWRVDGERPAGSLAYDAVIDASNAAALPALALDLVEPGKRVVYIGLAGTPSTIDTRTLALKDVTAVGILSGSPGLAGAIDAYASGAVDPRSLVAATVGLRAGRRRPRRMAPRRCRRRDRRSTSILADERDSAFDRYVTGFSLTENCSVRPDALPWNRVRSEMPERSVA